MAISWSPARPTANSLLPAIWGNKTSAQSCVTSGRRLADAPVSIDNHPAPGAGACSGMTREHASEVAPIGEAAGTSDRGHRCIAIAKHGFGGFDPGLKQPRVRRNAGRFAECPREVADRQPTSRGNVLQGRRAGEIANNQFLGPPFLPWSESAFWRPQIGRAH